MLFNNTRARKFYIAGLLCWALAAVFHCVKVSHASEEDICVSFADFARSIMEVRLSGLPKQRAMDIVEGKSSKVRGLAREIILKAYEWPYEGEDDKAINSFGNSVYQSCYRAMFKDLSSET